ncbi:MAG TPA: hypothetical protein VMG35_09330 [Bryobacteraceae bacterium]|nr:hypothetical protein [Bryobacteraceae bacterium]
MCEPREPLLVFLVCLLSVPLLKAHQPHDPISAVAVSPDFAQDLTIFAATGALSIKINAYALLRSTDGGVTWLPVNGLFNNSQINAIVFSPAYSQDQTVYVGAAGGLFQTTNQGTSWVQLYAKPVKSLALSPNFAVDNTLLAVTNKSIIESTNRGQSWKMLSAPSPLTANLTAVAISPNFAADNTLLLGGAADGIFKSTNGGANWTHVTTGMSPLDVAALAFSPSFATDRAAFAGTLGSGFLVSTNAGASWTTSNSGLTDLNVSSIAFSPTYLQDSALWVTTGGAGVFESNSRGAAWTFFAAVPRALSAQTTVHYQAVAAARGASGAMLYLAMYEGLWTAQAGASAWQYVDIIPTRLVRFINIAPAYARSQTLFANTYGGGNLWSTTGGTSWTFQNTGMQNAYVDAGGFSPNYTADGTAFSSMGLGLERTVDHGATWQLVPALGAETYPRALAVSPGFANDATVLIGTDNEPGNFYPPYVTYQGKQYPNQGLFLSLDGGVNWIPTSLGGPPIVSIAFSPAFATDRTAFAASPSDGLYKSTDGGMTWSSLAQPIVSNQMCQVVVSPDFAQDHTVFAAAITGGIVKSLDGGSTWAVLSRTSNMRANDIELSPNYANDQTVFLGTVQNGLMRSKNGGSSFTQLTSFPDHFVTAVGISGNYAKDSTLFAAGYSGIYKSTNRGATWTYLAEPARIEDTRNVASKVDQQPPTVTYQGTWTQVNPAALASTNAYRITSEPQDTATVQFTGSGIRWLSWTGPEQGSASLQLDGMFEGEKSLTAPVDQFQQNVFELHGIPCGLHSLTVTALPLSGQTVSVDAFDIWVDGCPLLGLREIH